jgi:hypothetical protein
MTNEDVLDYLKFEKKNLLRIIGDNANEFNQGRLYAMDKMIEGVEGLLLGVKHSCIPIEDLRLSVRSYGVEIV